MAKTFTLNQVDFLKDPSKAILFEEFLQKHSYHEDKITQVIYTSKSGDFLGESQITITNEQNLFTRTCHTAAKFESGEIWTSENVVKIIGQSNYDKVFTALCSILNEEWKVKSIFALLTKRKECKEKCIQTCDNYLLDKNSIKIMDMSEEQVLSMNLKHQAAQIRPGIKVEMVPDSLNNSAYDNLQPLTALHTSSVDGIVLNSQPSLENMDLVDHADIDDVASDTTDYSQIDNFSFSNLTNIELNQDSLMQDIDNQTESGTVIKVFNKTIRLPFTPIDQFHIASRENLLKMPNQDLVNILIMHQRLIDYKYCKDADDEQMLPIHHAVIDNDIEVVERHSAVLHNKDGTVDVLADGDTPLHLAIINGSKEAVQILLSKDASISIADKKERNALHLAVEAGDEDLLKCIDYHCEKNPSYVKEELTQKWCEKDLQPEAPALKAALMEYLCSHYNSQGCTPLMLACRAGNHKAAEVLVKMATKTVNCRSPNGGETALFLTITNACLDASKRGKNAKISEAYVNTVKVLLDGGAETEIANFSGITISQILSTDYNYPELTMLLLNRDFYNKYIETNKFEELNKMMLVKVQNDKIQLSEVNPLKAISNSQGTSKKTVKIAPKISSATPDTSKKVVKIAPKPNSKTPVTSNESLLKFVPITNSTSLQNGKITQVKILPARKIKKRPGRMSKQNNYLQSTASNIAELVKIAPKPLPKTPEPIIVRQTMVHNVSRESNIKSNITDIIKNQDRTKPIYVKILPSEKPAKITIRPEPKPFCMERKLVPFDKTEAVRRKRKLDKIGQEKCSNVASKKNSKPNDT